MSSAAENLDQETQPQDRPSGIVAVSRAVYRQGNWKREKWVATEYEIRQAIDTLLRREKIAIIGGVLAIPEMPSKGDIRMRLALASIPKTREERWAREDDELRRFCQEIATSETQSRKPPEDDDLLASGSAVFSSIRGDPRRGIGKYVLRELRLGSSSYLPLEIRRVGPATDTNVVRAIEEQGGLEWVLEEARVDGRKAKGKRR